MIDRCRLFCHRIPFILLVLVAWGAFVFFALSGTISVAVRSPLCSHLRRRDGASRAAFSASFSAVTRERQFLSRNETDALIVARDRTNPSRPALSSVWSFSAQRGDPFFPWARIGRRDAEPFSLRAASYRVGPGAQKASVIWSMRLLCNRRLRCWIADAVSLPLSAYKKKKRTHATL